MSTSTSNVLHPETADAFAQVLQHDGTTVVDFWAPWCGPCQAYGPTVEAYADEAPDHIQVAKVNVDEIPEAARQHGIRSIPTTLFFRDGEVVDRANGLLNADELRQRAEAL
jgi:thioredoxin 1